MKTSAALLVGGSVTAVSAMFLAAKMFSSKSSEKKDITLEDIDDEYDESEMITPDEVCKIFDDLFMHMQGVISQIGMQVQQLQMQGQTIPDQQLRKLLKQEFDRNLTAKQPEVCEKYGIDEDCFEEATKEFLKLENESVKKAVTRFQKFYENVSGESISSDGGKSEGKSKELLSSENLLEAAEIYFNALTDSMGEIVQKFKEKGMSLNDPAIVQQLQMQFAAVANEAGEKALDEKMGISTSVFQASIQKHANDPQVGRALAMLQMKQQQDLMVSRCAIFYIWCLLFYANYYSNFVT